MNISGYLMEWLQGLAFFAEFLVLLMAAVLVREWPVRDRIRQAFRNGANPALAASLGGYVIAVSIVFCGAYIGPSEGLVQDLGSVAAYTVIGVILLNIARVVCDWLILYQFRIGKEVFDDANTGTGVVVGACYIASGLIMAGAVHGEGGGPLTAVVFAVAGLAVLVIYGLVYEALTGFGLHDEIERNNAAAGFAFAGSLVAVGIVLGGAASGDFVSYTANFADFGVQAVLAFLLLVVVRFVIDRIHPSMVLERRIKRGDLSAGILEATGAIGAGLVLAVTL